MLNTRSAMGQRVSAFVDKPKSRLDTRKLVTIDTDIKNACTEITMNMLRQLCTIAEEETYPNVARYMMMIASMSPIKCMCVGISPYENGILPTFGGAVAYSPTSCIGSTPSVQVMSQVMSSIAVNIKKTFVSRKKHREAYPMMDREQYISKFAMMLRCSYSCLSAGVAFVNASPVVTSNTAKRVRAASIFSEWVGGMIEIHHRNQYKLTIVSMGALAESTMNDVFKSYAESKSKVNYTKTVNPALFQHMNVNKQETVTPISNEITKGEIALDEIMGISTPMTVRAQFVWNTYPEELLLSIIGETSIMRLTRLLVDEAPEDLLNTFVHAAVSVYTDIKMDMNDILSAMNSTPAAPDIQSNDSTTSAQGFNPFGNPGSQVGVQMNTTQTQQANSAMNPFLAAANEVNTSSDTRVTQSGNVNSEASQGVPMINRRSTIGQMIDPSGKAVSHHVIVLDSMIRTLSECVTNYKELHGDLGELLKRQANIYVKLSEGRMRTPDEVEELNDFLESFAEFCTELMSKMEEAYATAAALPAVVEGDRGVYEHETQPAAPMMRRADGSTMTDYVYTDIRRNAERNEDVMGGGAQASWGAASDAHRPQPAAPASATTQSVMGTTPVMNSPAIQSTSQANSALNPFFANQSRSVAVPVDLSTTGDTSKFEDAKMFVYSCADDMLEEIDVEEEELEGTRNRLIQQAISTNWSNNTFTDIEAEIIASDYMVQTAKGNMNVLDCISLIVAEYMSVNESNSPSRKTMDDIFTILNEDDEERTGFINMIPTWIKSTTSALEMINMLEDEVEDAVEGAGEA